MKSSSSTNSEPPGPVESPCRRKCCLDDADVCLGCGRTLSEILEWGRADRARRLHICQAAGRRLQSPDDMP
ncbi:MAG: DUF1289 domain-containing protein [Pseudomonas sp.]|nr:MAG: DUF1289 domain-containing protein [Pseudomonas sp.]